MVSTTSWPSAPWRRARSSRVRATCRGARRPRLTQLALGKPDEAGRLAEEELELARTFGAPRALGMALRATGLVAGGDRGELLLREAVEAFGRGDAAVERVRALDRSRRVASAAKPAQRGAGAPARGTRRRASTRCQTRRRTGRGRAPRDRGTPAALRPQRARVAHGERAPRGRARASGADQPRDRADVVHHRAHGRGSSHERLPQAAARLAGGARGRPVRWCAGLGVASTRWLRAYVTPSRIVRNGSMWSLGGWTWIGS